MNRGSMIVIQKQKSNQKFECQKMIHVQPKFMETKVQAKEWLLFFLMKSGLIKTVP
jgi:hypothetical protein